MTLDKVGIDCSRTELSMAPRERLRACEVGDIRSPERSLVARLLARGVNVLASTQKVDDELIRRFFITLLDYWLPSGVSTGLSLSWAIRSAARQFQLTTSDNRDVANAARVDELLDSFVLFGSPTLRIAFERTPDA